MSIYKESFRHVALHRLNDPITSKEAAKKVKLTDLRQKVLGMIRDAGSWGITSKEMQKLCPELTGGSISSRPKELLKQGLIFYAGDKRDGARVIRCPISAGRSKHYG